jgi:hypothetical protein
MGYLLDAYGTVHLPSEGVHQIYLDQAFGFNLGGLITARIGLGVFEAAFGPGIPLYMCSSHRLHSFMVRAS